MRILTILFGVFLIVFGEIDDSPGAQLIGLISVVTGIVLVIISKKKSSE